MGSSQNSPRVFVSYAWEGGASSPYREWVGTLCSRLRDDGIDVRLDRWHQGERTFVQFMNAEVREADRVLILCSPEYREKVHASESTGDVSGSGWEAMLIGANMVYARGKVALALTLGDWVSAAPDFLLAFPFADLRNIDSFEANYRDLLRRLHGLAEPAPEVRDRPADLALSPPSVVKLPYRSVGTAARARNDHLATQLKDALLRRSRLRALAAPTRDVDAEIINLKRQLREGGRLPAGDCLGHRFILKEQLGEGGYATVWRANDMQQGMDVAIKVLHSNLAGNPASLDRFRRGARIMAELDHPNIVKIIEHGGEDSGWHYFVMECLSGGDLAKKSAVSFNRNQIFDQMLRIADALVYTHSQGHVHRDVKPANILLTEDGVPKLSDFDLVLTHDTTGGTRSGALGTFIYAAPESLSRPQGVDERADVYGLAMTLLYCLAGNELTVDVVRSPTPLLNHIQAPKALRDLVERALSWDLAHRYRSVTAFRDALLQCRAELDGAGRALPPSAPPASIPDVQPDPASTGHRNTDRAVVTDVPLGPAVASAEVAERLERGKPRRAWLIAASLGLSVAIATTLSVRKQRQDVAKATATGTASTALGPIEPARSESARATLRDLPPKDMPSDVSSASPDALKPPKRVIVAATPPTARIVQDGKDLGTGPLMIEVEDGVTSNLEFRAEGYAPLKMSIDGKRTPINAKLVMKPLPSPPPKKKVQLEEKPAATKAKKVIEGIVDPWR